MRILAVTLLMHTLAVALLNIRLFDFIVQPDFLFVDHANFHLL